MPRDKQASVTDEATVAIDDTFVRLEEARENTLQEEMISIAASHKPRSDHQIEADVERFFPRVDHNGRNVPVEQHVEILKRRSILISDTLQHTERWARRGLAYGRINQRDIDGLRLETSRAFDGISAALRNINRTIGEVDRRAIRASNRKVSPFTVTMLSGAAVLVVGMYLKVDEKVLMGLVAALIGAVYELQRRLGGSKREAVETTTIPPPATRPKEPDSNQ